MKSSQRKNMKYLITSALPYINGVKHLGNFVGSMLPADVYARFLRQEGETVIFVCATDEHGTPAEIAAKEAGLDIESYCQNQHQLQAEIYKSFLLSFDFFGRTSSKYNYNLTQHFYKQLDNNGFIEEHEIKQMYSLEDDRFLPDRYIIGTCPNCGYSSARGDQCENCTSVLDPTELQNPRSAISGSTRLEIRKSKHLFLKLSALKDEIQSWISSHNNWPNLTKSIAMKWLNEGLKDRCITRDLNWGVPVPRSGFEGKVFYVWFDAPIEYIAATQEWALEDSAKRDWKTWWDRAEDVKYVQFMAKDNLPFHTIMWPAMILGTREKWKMADYIKGFNWLTYYGNKFSTSAKRGVFLDQALDILPADYWRYALIAMAPESSDSAFTWELLQIKVNKDLADNLGNFVNRILKFASTHFGSTIPEGSPPGNLEQKLQETCNTFVIQLKSFLRNMEFRKAAETLCSLWSIGNQYSDERAPWLLIKEDREAAAQVIRTCINLIYFYAIISKPFIPLTAEKIFDALNISEAERMKSFSNAMDLNVLPPGHSFNVPSPLFRKLDDAEIKQLRIKFGGVAE
ncbi:methionine--tRNA ligase [Chlorogloeopsis sp. ULAP02]|uniref:methionine--tRNA ligase n=1 Tax=Chlorogloeopsis sp. ULAP02 TaxID=3107926 RepID=UPI00313514C4